MHAFKSTVHRYLLMKCNKMAFQVSGRTEASRPKHGQLVEATTKHSVHSRKECPTLFMCCFKDHRSQSTTQPRIMPTQAAAIAIWFQPPSWSSWTCVLAVSRQCCLQKASFHVQLAKCNDRFSVISSTIVA